MDVPKTVRLDLEPLKITCTGSDCANNLHCFKATRQMRVANQVGACRSCGVQLVDWPRVHDRNLSDAKYTFECLRYELIRHHFWHVEIDEKAVLHARRKGVSRMRMAVASRIRKSVGPAMPAWDGRQTPLEGSGNSICYAQHATASCCRKCVEYWHRIPQGRELTEEEINYLTELAMMYILDRMPFLTENGEKIAGKRGKREF
jgi:hypothetical protein